MSGKPTESGEIIRAYLLEHSSLPSRTIARQLMELHPGRWTSIDTVRASVRDYRGAGNKATKVVAPPSPLSHSVSAIESNPFFCPPSDEREWKPFVITVPKEDDTLILSDIHIPYQNNKAIITAISAAKQRVIRRIILNGDTIDCYQLSRFCKDPKLRSFKGELELTKDFLTELRDHFPKAEIIWKDGNHSERLLHYLMSNARELFGLDCLSYPALLDFVPLRINYVTDKRPIVLGKNNIIHGHEYPAAMIGPVNPARGLFLRAKTNAICGHYHQVSEHSEKNLKGELIGCWSTGCLCELHPGYMPINKWSHGFAIQRTSPDGSFEVDNKKIIEGRVM